jgi:hypothetical protein
VHSARAVIGYGTTVDEYTVLKCIVLVIENINNKQINDIKNIIIYII